MPVLRLNTGRVLTKPGLAALGWLPGPVSSSPLPAYSCLMSPRDDREPLFVYRHFAGVWMLNHRNPVGLALILAFTLGIMLLLVTF